MNNPPTRKEIRKGMAHIISEWRKNNYVPLATKCDSHPQRFMRYRRHAFYEFCVMHIAKKYKLEN